MKTITMTLFNRPKYTKLVLDCLSKCEDIEKYYLMIFVDPGNQEVVDLANSVKFVSKEVTTNKRKLGCDRNIYNAINNGFKRSDYNIHIEDDICPGKDMLKYFEFCDYRYRYDPTVLTVCAYHKGHCDEDHYDRIFRNPWFTPWGWATWKDRWEEIERQWDFNNAWDIHFNNVIRKDRFEIRPYLARAQNIGELAGAHVSADVFWKDHYNEFWVDSVNYKTDNFVEMGD